MLCAWSDGTDSSLHSSSINKEHVFGQQFREMILNRNPNLSAAQRMADGKKSSFATSDPTLWIAQKFCSKCNAGWMGALDSEARPIVERLISEVQEPTGGIELDSEEASTLRSWAYKVTLALDFVAASTPKFRDEVRHQFFQSGIPPESAGIGVAVNQIGDVGSFYFMTEPHQVVADSPVSLSDRVLCVFALADLVIQVGATSDGGLLRYGEAMLGFSPATSTTIGAGSGFAWPPAEAITDEQMLENEMRIIRG